MNEQTREWSVKLTASDGREYGWKFEGCTLSHVKDLVRGYVESCPYDCAWTISGGGMDLAGRSAQDDYGRVVVRYTGAGPARRLPDGWQPGKSGGGRQACVSGKHERADGGWEPSCVGSLCPARPSATEEPSVTGSRSCQSAGAYPPQTCLIQKRLEELERQRRNLLLLVCRILQGSPGYRLRPSELAVGSVGDLSCLSQESRACLYNQMVKD